MKFLGQESKMPRAASKATRTSLVTVDVSAIPGKFSAPPMEFRAAGSPSLLKESVFFLSRRNDLRLAIAFFIRPPLGNLAVTGMSR